MKAIFKILLWLAGVVVILTLTGFFLPNTSHVERTAVINAKPEAVYGLLNNLTTYDRWMPWNKMDPDWKVEYATQNTGKGAWYKWQSQNRNVGNGKLTIDESLPNEKVITKMEFEGFNEPAYGGWQLTASGNRTELKWFMDSKMGNNPFYRWMGVFMDKMVGPMFDSGLSNISKLAERAQLTDIVTPLK